MNYPENCPPSDKIALTYLFPFLNEKKLGIWNKGDSHNIDRLEQDKNYADL